MLIFTFNTKNTGAQYKSGVVIFCGSAGVSLSEVQQEYQTWTAKNVPLEHTFVVGNATCMRALATQPDELAYLERLDLRSTSHLVGYDGCGHFFDIPHSTSQDSSEQDISAMLHSAMDSFVENRVQLGNVVVPAPPGFYFEKLSGRYASHFIRAESLFESTLDIELLALSLLPKFTTWCDAVLTPSSAEASIYIDTMAIWPIAEKLAALCANKTDIRFHTESFRSYDGLEGWRPPGAASFAILSASTSGGLASKVRAKLGKRGQVVTLLGLRSLGDEKSDGDTRFFIPRNLEGLPSLDGMRKTFEPSVAPLPLGCEPIRLVGERFISHSARPKLARLAHKALNDEAKKRLPQWAKLNAVVAARRSSNGKTYWPISFDLDVLLRQFCDIDGKLKSWLVNYAPRGRIAVIYPSPNGTSAQAVTEGCKEMAQKVKVILDQLDPGCANKIDIYASKELSSSHLKNKVNFNDIGIIVVAPVIGGGFAFKDINAQLRRLKPKGPRLFLTFVALTDSLSQFGKLQIDLTVNSDDSGYQFRCAEHYPIGRLGEAANWDKDAHLSAMLCDELTSRNGCIPYITDRTERLQKGQGLPGDYTFLPMPSGKPLELAAGYAMWQGSESISGAEHGAAVLLTMAATLEASRDERMTGKGETALKAGTFQQTLIDPEMFTRYNDGVIQAAILRASYPSELDYSMSRDASAAMTALLHKWVSLWRAPAGEALPEFMFALYTRKLRIQEEHLKEVLDSMSCFEGWLADFAKIVREELQPSTQGS